jgi:hypothetical protein
VRHIHWRPAIARVAALAALVVLGGSAYSAVTNSQAAQTPRPGSYSGKVAVDTINFKVSANGRTITGLGTTFNPAADCGIPVNQVHERFPTL